MNNRRWIRIGGVLFALAYILIICLFVFSSFNLSKSMQSSQKKYLNEIESKLNTILEEPVAQMPESLNYLVQEYPLEVVIEYQDEIIYASSEISFSEGYVNVLNAEAVALESSGSFNSEGKKFHIWYAIYNMPNNDVLDNFFLSQFVLNLIAMAIIVLVTFLMQRLLISPLSEIKQAIKKMDEYDFDVQIDEKDEVRAGLSKFAKNLNEDIQKISYKQTELGGRLEEKEVLLNNMLTVSKGVVHELKTPLYQLIHFNESYIEESDNELAKANIEQAEVLLADVNHILDILKNPNDLVQNISEFDLAELIVEEARNLRSFLQKNELALELDIPEKFLVVSHHTLFNLLVQNLLLNSCQYAIKGSGIHVILEQTNEGYLLSCANESTVENIERMQGSEVILRVVSDENKYSGGNGLFIIKNLVSILGGSYELQTDNNKVSIIMNFHGDSDE